MRITRDSTLGKILSLRTSEEVEIFQEEKKSKLKKQFNRNVEK